MPSSRKPYKRETSSCSLSASFTSNGTWELETPLLSRHWAARTPELSPFLMRFLGRSPTLAVIFLLGLFRWIGASSINFRPSFKDVVIFFLVERWIERCVVCVDGVMFGFFFMFGFCYVRFKLFGVWKLYFKFLDGCKGNSWSNSVMFLDWIDNISLLTSKFHSCYDELILKNTDKKIRTRVNSWSNYTIHVLSFNGFHRSFWITRNV